MNQFVGLFQLPLPQLLALALPPHFPLPSQAPNPDVSSTTLHLLADIPSIADNYHHPSPDPDPFRAPDLRP